MRRETIIRCNQTRAGKKLSGLKLRKIVFKITRLPLKILKVLILIKSLRGIGDNRPPYSCVFLQ